MNSSETYISKLGSVERIADKIEDALEKGDIEFDRNEKTNCEVR